MLSIGPHLSISQGYAKAAQTARDIGASAFQIFSRNPRGSRFRKPDEKDEETFRLLCKQYAFGPLQAHAPYTLNLASPRGEAYEFSKRVLAEDVVRMDRLGINTLVLHPGSHVGSGMEEGIARIAAGLAAAAEAEAGTMILIETMHGGGTEIGFRFEQLGEILARAGHEERLGVCLDTCHVFAAGYDIKNDLEGVLAQFDRAIGLPRLKSVHLNDGMGAPGSKKDRHMPLGGGEIGMEAILNILSHPALCGLPFYTETPLDDEGHRVELAAIRQLAAQRGQV